MTVKKDYRRSPIKLPERIQRRTTEILSDGKWHPWEKVLSEGIKLVPPGIAMRQNERSRVASSGNGKPRKIPRTPEQLIRSGAREIARMAIKSTDAYEFSEDGKRLRLRYEPRVVRGDKRRAEMLLPALDALAETFRTANADWSWKHVQATAHDQGIHLSSCPRGCTLIPITPPDFVDLELPPD